MTSQDAKESFERIAIIGAACRFPQAPTVEAFWRNLREGKEAIRFFSDEELLSAGVEAAQLLDPNYVKATGFLSGVELFDASFFGFTSREAEIMDPQHRLFLECAWEALETAGYEPWRYRGSIGVYAGTSRNTYQLNLFSRPEIAEALGGLQLELANEKDHLATRVSYKLNLTGPSVNIQTACSTSLVAVHMACQALLTYQCDMALTGGVSVKVPIKEGYLYQEGGIASPDGHCRPFDAEARGTVRGSGVGLVVLKRLSDALADGDSIQALILGSAINNDGAWKAGYSAPSQRGQAEVIVAAQAAADVEADTITYIEAHGTGTPLGDPIEIAALQQAFRDSTSKRGFCALGSVKSNLGHLDAAAGIAGLIKTVQALRHRTLPPTLHFRKPNPEINFDQSPFYVNSSVSAWQPKSTPLRAGVSSFGMGGTNAHVILEEYRPENSSLSRRPWHLLLLSAKTKAALEKTTENLSNYLKQHADANIADIAYTLQVGRKAFAHRRAVLCQSLNDAVTAIESPDAIRHPNGFLKGRSLPVVFMFPGQGAQRINMARQLYQSEPSFKEQVDLCSDYLRAHLEFDLRHFLYPPDERLPEATRRMDQTVVAQPALFVIEYALARLLQEHNVKPEALIGHSVGEYVAACLAGVFTLNEALSLIAARGKLFEHLPVGAMLSVALPSEEVEPLLSNSMSIAAVNAPSLCVVSGANDAVEQLRAKLAQRGVACRQLHTSHAFHSPMVEPILEVFAEKVRRANPQPPRIRLVSSLTGDWMRASEATDPRYWARQLRESVRFADGIGLLLKNFAGLFLEVGPGQALTTFARQQSDNISEAVLLPLFPDHRNEEQEYAQWLNTLGRLWALGAPLDETKIYAGESRRRIALPTYPFEHTRYWIEERPATGPISTSGRLSKKKDITDWLYVPSWKSSVAPLRLRPGYLDENRQCWLVFVGADRLSESLVERLRRENQCVTTVRVGEEFSQAAADCYVLNPSQRQDYKTLFEHLRAEHKSPAQIIHLWTLTHNGSACVGHTDTPDVQLQLGFYSLLFLAQSLGRDHHSEKISISVVTDELQSISGQESGCPEAAAMLGLLTVIPQEYSDLVCRSIDVSVRVDSERPIDKLTEQLLCELTTDPQTETVALRDRHRWVRGFEPLRWRGPAAETARLRKGGVYLITGGLGRIGLALAEHLARTVQAKLVLTGRTPLPDWRNQDLTQGEAEMPEEVAGKIKLLREIEALGAEILVLSADAADEEKMRQVVEQACERFGPINGVIHSAGVVRGESLQPIHTLDVALCETQLRAKVQGLRVLERVLRQQKLDFCLLNSSLASVLGGLGFAAYAAANSFMDAFARQQSEAGSFSWSSINWDGWRFPDEPELPLGADIRQAAMTVAEGVEVFESILQLPHVSQVVVSTSELEGRLRRWVTLQDSPQANEVVPARQGHDHSELDDGFIAPGDSLEHIIAEVWQEFLGLSQVGSKDDFLELGGHSLLAMHVIARLRNIFQVEIPLHRFFETPTVESLAEVVEELLIEKLEKLPDGEDQQPV